MDKKQITERINTAIAKLKIEKKTEYTAGEMLKISAVAFGENNKNAGLGYVMQVLRFGRVKWLG